MAAFETAQKSGVNPDRVRDVIQRLEGLPALFPVILRALSMARDSLCSNRDLERVLSVDQAVVAQLLRVANSAYYSLQGRVSTVSRAITVIGHDRLSSLLLQMLVGGWFRRVTGASQHARRIWEDSVAAAAACQALGEFSPPEEQEELLICGLLHNIGELALMANFKREYEQAMDLAESRGVCEAQREVFGVDSRQVGRWVAEAWDLPRINAEAAEHWEDPFHETVDPADRHFLSVVHLGVHLGKAWAQKQGVQAVFEKALPDAFDRLALDADALTQMYEGLPERVARVRFVLE